MAHVNLEEPPPPPVHLLLGGARGEAGALPGPTHQPEGGVCDGGAAQARRRAPRRRLRQVRGQREKALVLSLSSCLSLSLSLSALFSFSFYVFFKKCGKKCIHTRAFQLVIQINACDGKSSLRVPKF